MFQITHKDLGVIKKGVLIKIQFPYTDINLVLRVEAGCDCSEVHNDSKNKQIVVSYTPNGIPKHLVEAGQRSFTPVKEVIITYNIKDGGESLVQRLTFSGTIKEI